MPSIWNQLYATLLVMDRYGSTSETTLEAPDLQEGLESLSQTQTAGTNCVVGSSRTSIFPQPCLSCPHEHR